MRAGPRPREWPVYRGYGSLLARARLAAVVTDLDYTNSKELSAPIAQLDEVTHAARSEPGVDRTQVLLWALSGGAKLLVRMIEEPPNWLRVSALPAPSSLGCGALRYRSCIEAERLLDEIASLRHDLAHVGVSQSHGRLTSDDREDEVTVYVYTTAAELEAEVTDRMSEEA